MPFNAYPIIPGSQAMGLRGATDVFVSSDIAAGILDAKPRGPKGKTRDDIHGDPYTMGALVVTFRHDATLPFRTLAMNRFGRLENYTLAHVLALGV
jgi:hypothetical protein